MPCESGPSYNVEHELTKVTRLLCEACKLLDTLKNNSLFQASPELQTWWVKHKQADAQRRATEKRREQEAKLRRRLEYEQLRLEFADDPKI